MPEAIPEKEPAMLCTWEQLLWALMNFGVLSRSQGELSPWEVNVATDGTESVLSFHTAPITLPGNFSNGV